MAKKSLQIIFLQAPRSLRVKHGKFTQRQPQCNIPDIFWSCLSSISICTLSFRHLMLAVVIQKSIHVLTAGGNVCPNKQKHKRQCCWVHRKLLQVSGTWFHTVSFSSSFLQKIVVILVIAVTLQSLPSQSGQVWAGFLLLPEQYHFHSSWIAIFLHNSRFVHLWAAVSYGQQFTLCCCYRFWHVLQWILFFPCFRHRPNLPGVLGNGAWVQFLEDTHLHPVQRESGVCKIWLWCCDKV